MVLRCEKLLQRFVGTAFSVKSAKVWSLPRCTSYVSVVLLHSNRNYMFVGLVQMTNLLLGAKDSSQFGHIFIIYTYEFVHTDDHMNLKDSSPGCDPDPFKKLI